MNLRGCSTTLAFVSGGGLAIGVFTGLKMTGANVLRLAPLKFTMEVNDALYDSSVQDAERGRYCHC